jgi:hypothetical protein
MFKRCEDYGRTFTPEDVANLPKSLEEKVYLVHNRYLKAAIEKARSIREDRYFILSDIVDDCFFVALLVEIERLRKLVDKNKLEVPDEDDVGTPVNLNNIEPDKFTIPVPLSSSKVPSNETFDVIKQHIKALSDLLPIDEKADDEADEMMQEVREKASLGTRKIDRNVKNNIFYNGLVGLLRDDFKIYWTDKGFIDKCLKQLELIIIQLSKKNNLIEITKYFKFSYCPHIGCYFYYQNTQKTSFAVLQCFEQGGVSFSGNRGKELYSFKLTSTDNITDAVEYLSEWFQEEK